MTNFMSFGESVFSAGFIQKTVKGDLFFKGNYGIPPRKQRGKVLEDSRRLSTKANPEGLPCGASRPTFVAVWPKLRHGVFWNLLEFSFVVFVG